MKSHEIQDGKNQYSENKGAQGDQMKLNNLWEKRIK
jgi:hypothetical protein